MKKRVHKRRFKPIHHHVKHHYAKYRETPPGIKVLILYSVCLAALYFVLGLLFPTTFVFGHELNGISAQFINFISFGILVSLVYGYTHKRKWAWEFSLIWYILSLVSSFFAILTRSSDLLSMLSDSIFLSSLVILFINGLTIWYIYKRKEYFKKAKHIHDTYDKVYIHFMTIFFVILLLSGTLLVLNFYQNTTRAIDDSINTLRGHTLEEALFTCSNEDQPRRDICFLTIAVIETERVDKDMCSLIFSNFYRLTCFEALS